MTLIEKRLFILTNLIISSVGVLYFIFKTFFDVETPYGVRPHEFTSSLLHAHIITVPLLLIIVGLILGKHSIPKLRAKKNKRKISGISLIVFFVLMTFSGYLLQVGLGLDSIFLIGWGHILISVLWMLVSFWHIRY